MGKTSARVFKAVRLKANKSQMDVAKRLGFSSAQAISNLERAVSPMPATWIKPVSKLLDCDPLYLVAAAVQDFQAQYMKEAKL